MTAVDRDAVAKLLEGRANPPDETFVFGAQRVVARLEGEGNGPFRVSAAAFEFLVDEPPERGGTDAGPNPLQYFLAGAATCLLSHYMLNAIADGLEIRSLELTARGHYNRVLVGGAFREVIYDVKVESGEPPERLREWAERADEQCYASNTLANGGVTITTNLRVNGELVATLTRAPADGR